MKFGCWGEHPTKQKESPAQSLRLLLHAISSVVSGHLRLERHLLDTKAMPQLSH